MVQVERLLTVEFGPSRSKRFAKALAEAKSGAGECSEIEPGRYRVTFLLGADEAPYASLARLLQRVRSWRATDVYEGAESLSTYHAKEMGYCASSQLTMFGECQWRFYWGVPPRCALCPLLDAKRALRDALGENPPAGVVLEITLGPNLRALGEEIPPGLDPAWQVPNYPPAEWEGEPPPGQGPGSSDGEADEHEQP